MERIYIGIFGRVNAGKSTLMNLLVGGEVAVTSPVAGTTTDAVRKNGEILGLGAVTYIDTAGSDDTSELGSKRIDGTRAVMEQVDIALLVYRRWGAPEQELLRELGGVPVVRVQNMDGTSAAQPAVQRRHCERSEAIQHVGKPDCFAPDGARNDDTILFEALNDSPEPIFAAIKKALPPQEKPSMFGDRIEKGDRVVLVMPIDSEAPAGRLILPQVQAIRELLDRGAIATAVQPDQLADALQNAPKLVVTDSQVIAQVKRIVGECVERKRDAEQAAAPRGGRDAKAQMANAHSPSADGVLSYTTPEVTSFSILLAAARGDRELYEKGLAATERLQDGDRILIAESCTHQSSCDDIGRVKIPRWLRDYTGKRLEFDIVSGLAPLPKNLSEYALAIQCGGCMVSRRQLLNRLRRIAAADVPVTNYGMLINKITK